MSDRTRDKHRHALENWKLAYTKYLEGGPHGPTVLREELDAVTLEADLALVVAQCDVAAPDPSCDEMCHGLKGVVPWLHDGVIWRSKAQSTALLDVIDQAITEIEKQG